MAEIIWVLAIDYQNGVDLYAHRTEAGARQSLAEYVDRHWAFEFDDEEPPADIDERIEKFFDDLEGQSYTLDNIALND